MLFRFACYVAISSKTTHHVSHSNTLIQWEPFLVPILWCTIFWHMGNNIAPVAAYQSSHIPHLFYSDCCNFWQYLLQRWSSGVIRRRPSPLASQPGTSSQNNTYVYPQICQQHDDVIKWKHFPRYWPFVRGIHRPTVNSPHESQWRGAFMFSLICAWINGRVNNGEADDLRRHRAHYDVIVMKYSRPNANRETTNQQNLQITALSWSKNHYGFVRSMKVA